MLPAVITSNSYSSIFDFSTKKYTSVSVSEYFWRLFFFSLIPPASSAADHLRSGSTRGFKRTDDSDISASVGTRHTDLNVKRRTVPLISLPQIFKPQTLQESSSYRLWLLQEEHTAGFMFTWELYFKNNQLVYFNEAYRCWNSPKSVLFRKFKKG